MTSTTSTRSQEARGYPRLYRASDGRLVAGVARGLAEHLGVPTVWVRIAFVLLAFSGGAGLVMYGAFWVVVPLRGPDEDVDDSPSARDRDLLVLLGIGAVAVGAASLAARQGVGSAFLVPIMVSAVGVAVLWRQGDDAQRSRWRSHASRAAGGGLAAWVRLALGVVLVLGGLAWALATTGDVTQIADGLAAGLILVAGVALVAGPWLLRLVRELTEERRERIRSQERAEIAAHVHDSVLQTLDPDPAQLRRPAGGRPARPRRGARAARLAVPARRGRRGHVRRRAGTGRGAEVEDALRRDPRGRDRRRPRRSTNRCAALAAGRPEAMVNAAKHAGAATPVAVYAEVGDDAVEVFVRDRGPGFDVDAVAEDRLGVRQSIVGRMERNGGRAEVRSSGGRDRGTADAAGAAPERKNAMSDRPQGGPRRRPPDVPHRRPGRARRGRRRGR